MFKKINVLFISFCLLFLHTAPLMAQDLNIGDQAETQHQSKKIFDANDTITLAFVNDLDLNESNEGEVVKLKLANSFRDKDGDVLPKGTMFYGKIANLEKSKFGFRKAKANLYITKMTLPNGKSYKINAHPEQNQLESSTGANIAKGVATTFVSAGVCLVGAIVIAVECLSVGGIVLAPYTGAAAGIALGLTTKGVNYKVPAGTKIVIKFEDALDLFQN